jgi:phospholipid/cholesterol/gamma-HCH transport system ATP-binding protein
MSDTPAPKPTADRRPTTDDRRPTTDDRRPATDDRRPATDDRRPSSEPDVHIRVENLTMAYGSFVLMHDLTFDVKRGDIFVIMGASGCGKSTLLRHLIGLNEPAKGEIWYERESFTAATPARREEMLRRFGVLYQSGALWSSMTLAENIGLPLGEYTDLTAEQIRDIASLKLALVGLKGFEDFYPSQISGGMQKRAGLARAMALDPDVLFFDEPSAGLDPISSSLLDDLILELRESLGSTIVVVTHELASIFSIATNSIFLDVEARTMTALGPPKELLSSGNENVRRFLMRGKENGAVERSHG